MTTDPAAESPRGLRFLAELADLLQADPEAGAAELRELLDRRGGPPFTLTDADAAEFRAAAAPVVRILELTEPDQAAEAINHLLDRNPPRPRLVQLPGRPWALQNRPPEPAGLTHWLQSTAALALALWLTERGRCAWGRCAAPGCACHFIDTGRRTPQRYCSPRCATRVRVAAHRDRRTPGS
ncbi:CGNR zinc finger domain-containing protein [Kitasatospora sp. LaBMicrA B282]|uniref:CGNR zinc finger domain-containing protein n=1 Tax=Kitasatospora sp. LaBMicrA B282 TaxID=3420949 RepID=UPI003D11843E